MRTRVMVPAIVAVAVLVLAGCTQEQSQASAEADLCASLANFGDSLQAFQDLGARTLYLVHNSTFDLAFHGWREPLERVAALAQQRGIHLATPEIGEVLTLGKPRENRKWWEGLR